MREIASLVDPRLFRDGPDCRFRGDVIQPTATSSTRPLSGYVSYSIAGFRDRLVRFADIRRGQPWPSWIGARGTGIAVSAFSRNPKGVDLAYWIASGPIQRGLYAKAGGQPVIPPPGRTMTSTGTLRSLSRDPRRLDSAWVRPRHNGYMAFQQQASDRINKGLKDGEAARRWSPISTAGCLPTLLKLGAGGTGAWRSEMRKSIRIFSGGRSLAALGDASHGAEDDVSTVVSRVCPIC